MRRRGRRNYKNTAYSYSSEAYKIIPMQEYEYSAGVRRRNRRTKKKTMVARSLKAKNENFLASALVKLKAIKANYSMMRITFSGLVVFAYAMVIVNLLAVGSMKKSELIGLENEYKVAKESNIYLKTQIAETLDLEKIEKRAEKDLGMQKPATHQIVYIDVPMQSYVVQYEKNDSAAETFGLTRIIEDLLED